MGDEDFLDQLARTVNNGGRILAQAPEDLSGAQAPSCVYFFHRGLPLLKTKQHFFNGSLITPPVPMVWGNLIPPIFIVE